MGRSSGLTGDDVYAILHNKVGSGDGSGASGQDGVGISSIEKTGTEGLVDTYTITLTNNSTYTFTVTNGASGTSATIAVGTVTTGDTGTAASVTNVGTENNAILNFVIPKGDKGDDGASGVATQVDHETNDTTYILPPNQLHTWGEVTELNLSFSEGTSGQVNEYMFSFDSGETAMVLTLPNTVVSDLTVESYKHYEIRVLNDYLSWLSWELDYKNVTAEGETLSLENVKASNLSALSVYGKSTQDGTPSPENPVDIESAGDSGSIVITISDGDTQSQILTLSTPNGLPGIPVDSDGNYMDEDGQQWICDEIDFASGKYVQRVGAESLSNFSMNLTSDSSTRYSQFSMFPSIYKNGSYTALCNIATYTNWGSAHSSEYWYFAANQSGIYLNPPGSSNIESAEQLNDLLNNLDFPVIIVAQLATPIETDLTADEIAAYKALYTYSPNTVVSNDADAGMKIGYRELRE